MSRGQALVMMLMILGVAGVMFARATPPVARKRRLTVLAVSVGSFTAASLQSSASVASNLFATLLFILGGIVMLAATNPDPKD